MVIPIMRLFCWRSFELFRNRFVFTLRASELERRELIGNYQIFLYRDFAFRREKIVGCNEILEIVKF